MAKTSCYDTLYINYNEGIFDREVFSMVADKVHTQYNCHKTAARMEMIQSQKHKQKSKNFAKSRNNELKT